MKKAFTNLLKLKSILSLMYSATTCYLALNGKISTEVFMSITTAIIVYYFNKKDTKESDSNE
jgi:hypothetical protein